MNTDYVKYFLTVVQCGSINLASKKLNMNHQHLGRILTSIENEIGAKLLERNRVGVILTPQGKEVLNLLKSLDDCTSQLQTHFRISTQTQNKSFTIKLYFNSCINYTPINNFALKLQTILPNVQIDFQEATTESILKSLTSTETLSIGSIISFEDYPSLNIKNHTDLSMFHVLSCNPVKLIALAGADNPLLNKYQTISIESIVDKPLIFYSPYEIEQNHFYYLLKQYGVPNLKYVTSNLQTFYQLLKDTNCIAIGFSPENPEKMFNSLFSKDAQLAVIPIRENIQASLIRLIYKASPFTLNPEINNLLATYIW